MLGSGVKYSVGAISSSAGENAVKSTFQLSVPTQPGNSGGPVFLKSGAFCGIMVSTLNPFLVAADNSAIPQNVNYAVGSEAVEAFLERHSLLEEVMEVKRERLNVDTAKEFAVMVEMVD